MRWLRTFPGGRVKVSAKTGLRQPETWISAARIQSASPLYKSRAAAAAYSEETGNSTRGIIGFGFSTGVELNYDDRYVVRAAFIFPVILAWTETMVGKNMLPVAAEMEQI